KCVKEVVIVQEPDAEDFVEAVAASFDDKKVWVVKLPAKDPSELWLRSNPVVQEEPVVHRLRGQDGAIQEIHVGGETLSARIEIFLAAWNKAIDAAELLNDSFANTDTGNAERLVNKHGGNFRWVNEEGVFCIWNGSIWQK